MPRQTLVGCQVARLTVGGSVVTAIVHQYERDGKTDVRLYLLDRYIPDELAPGFKLTLT